MSRSLATITTPERVCIDQICVQQMCIYTNYLKASDYHNAWCREITTEIRIEGKEYDYEIKKSNTTNQEKTH